jgi:two-component system, NtrC family, response regulator AtoC
MAGRILIVDDDAGFARVLARGLKGSGHDVATCGTGADARTQFPQLDPDVVVLDYQLPDVDGLGLLDELRAMGGGAVFLMATAYPELDVAVEAMRRGAFDYVAKGSELQECLMRIERGAEVSLLRRRMAEQGRSGNTDDDGLLGDSSAMHALRHRLEALTGSDDTTVLIMGETGTGKGVVARAIHAKSGRAYEPFVAVDCTTIPTNLVETELFGHEKGAFSGASGTKMGRVEAAGRGTLFLDEIGELELAMQAKLLRLLEEREFTRVGSTRTRKVEARIITATNRDLERAVAEGWFRADLRYRLEVFVVEVPPLRERGDDIFLLTAHFVAERARALGRKEPRLHPKVIEWLPRYPFPGNVRELRNIVEQAVLLSGGSQLTLEDFPVLSRMAAGWAPPGAHGVPAPPTPASSGAPGPSTLSGPPAPGRSGPPTSPHPSSPQHASSAPPLTLGPLVSTPPDGPMDADPGPTLEDIRQAAEAQEREALRRALEASGGNVTAAARSLSLSRYQVLRRLKKFGLR